MNKRRILVVTGSRAEYGLQARLLKLIENDSCLELQLVVTGSHLSEFHGSTVHEIEADGIPICARIDLEQTGDQPEDISSEIGVGICKFASLLKQLKPDLIMVFGDRFEMLCPAIAALPLSLPVCHIAGGQLTEGTMDDAIRHSLTKLSHLHFTATDLYRTRIIQLGEDPNRVFAVGSLGLDAILNETRVSQTEFEEEAGFTLNHPSLLVTFHPATLDVIPADQQLAELLAALSQRSDLQLIFTMPNADPNHKVLRRLISDFVNKNRERASLHESLGRRLYLTALSLVDGVVGNSSSGLIEAPSFLIGTVNIGNRQQGRIRTKSIIDCEPRQSAIGDAIDEILSSEFRASIKDLQNPFGDGHADDRIIEIIRDISLEQLVPKHFYDVKF
jgi:UDP-hydrolysing UDP-N-acetyl-D-glucosamine 2-epimerase